MNGYTDKNLGLIGICNDFTFRDNLSAQVKSTLREHEVHFGPYDANELREILDQRVELAFIDGTLESGVVPYIAAEVGRDSGSARHAIDVLSLGGQIAEKEEIKCYLPGPAWLDAGFEPLIFVQRCN